MEPAVIGEDRSRFPARGTVGEIRRKKSQQQNKGEYTDLGIDLGEREEQVVCHALALALLKTDEAHREAEM